MRISDWSSDVCSSDLNRAQYRARASVINLRKTRVGAAVSAANAVILLHEGDVEASTITTWMRLIAPLDRPITVEVCIGGRLLPGVANLWPEDRRCRGGSGRRGRRILWRGMRGTQHSHGQDPGSEGARVWKGGV